MSFTNAQIADAGALLVQAILMGGMAWEKIVFQREILSALDANAPTDAATAADLIAKFCDTDPAGFADWFLGQPLRLLRVVAGEKPQRPQSELEIWLSSLLTAFRARRGREHAAGTTLRPSDQEEDDPESHDRLTLIEFGSQPQAEPTIVGPKGVSPTALFASAVRAERSENGGSSKSDRPLALVE